MGMTRLYAATRYSMLGILAAWREEMAFRQEVVLLLVLTPCALALARSVSEAAWLIAPCLLVIIVELLNSAIEAVVDRVGLEHHELSGRAKDMGSAAVFVCLVLWALIWGAVIWDRFNYLIG